MKNLESAENVLGASKIIDLMCVIHVQSISRARIADTMYDRLTIMYPILLGYTFRSFVLTHHGIQKMLADEQAQRHVYLC